MSYRLHLSTGRILKKLRRESVWTYCCLDYRSPLHMMLGQVESFCNKPEVCCNCDLTTAVTTWPEVTGKQVAATHSSLDLRSTVNLNRWRPNDECKYYVYPGHALSYTRWFKIGERGLWFEICINVLQIQVVERESETRTRDLRDSTPALWPLDHAASMLTWHCAQRHAHFSPANQRLRIRNPEINEKKHPNSSPSGHE